ncbi:hormonally up-regulated neu tumor-associated kinase homolog A-like [Sinocyclocheilus rhinocerous]|uniref:hormonally up-regulated neu tumor-associated kinase homolog A-like n=1 Tax=Sinocyclocheilus rhinocerous TaxID=307959 RepID=UPI0007B86880|nr:PREDICTED: hormonally up-regulated neu tumor-associated kinase homolog A-like [Sinocyclocheilus rhinocerous]
MSDTGTDMRTDSGRMLGVKAPLAPAGTENTPPSSLSSGLSRGQADILRNFYPTKRVGNYLIGRKLGEGSFAKVREGLHAITGEKVAVKVIDKKKAKKDSYVTKNLRREGHIQQMIRHPNITQLLDILETDNSYYLVMELCPGGNLMNHIYEKKRLEEREVQKYVRQLVMAVEHLHRAGVVHRDLKIENLLLDEQDNIKLIDFGLSNCAGILGYSDPFSTQCGSPAYAAPELLSRKKYGSKVDVWSIGVNMYAMLAGNLPFTVEPFSLNALHQRMVDKDMNPLPPSISSAATSLLKKLLEPDPVKRPNIHQVMADPWLQLGNPHTGVPYLNRIHIEEINHIVLLHMTEKMGYKHSEVLSTVLTNKACHTLTVYFLLNNKMKRISKEYREKQYNMEKEKKSELFQTQWRKPIEKITIPPKQTPAYLAVNKGPTKEKKHRNGLLKAVTGGFKDVYSGRDGCITSSSLEYMEIHPLYPTPQSTPTHPTPETQPDQKDRSKDSPKAVNVPARPPSSLAAHSWASASKEPSKVTPPSPWYKLTNGELSPPRHVSAFQPDSSYLKKATIPCIPVLIVKPQPKKASECMSSSESSGSSTSSRGSDEPDSPPVLIIKPQPKKSPPASVWLSSSESSGTPPSSRGSDKPDSPQLRIKFPSMCIGQILKKKVSPFRIQLPFRPERVVEVESPTPYHMQTLICATGALKTLC